MEQAEAQQNLLRRVFEKRSKKKVFWFLGQVTKCCNLGGGRVNHSRKGSRHHHEKERKTGSVTSGAIEKTP